MTPGDDDHDLGIGAIQRNAPATGTQAADGVSGPAGAAEAAPTAATEATHQADALDSVGASASIAATGSVEATASPLALDEISAALAAGSLSPAEAQSLLIDRVVATQVPEGADPAMVEEIRTEVAAALADDPTLAALLDPRG